MLWRHSATSSRDARLRRNGPESCRARCYDTGNEDSRAHLFGLCRYIAAGFLGLKAKLEQSGRAFAGDQPIRPKEESAACHGVTNKCAQNERNDSAGPKISP